MAFEIECPFCEGTGLIGSDPCDDCYGDGVISRIHEYLAVILKYIHETTLADIIDKVDDIKETVDEIKAVVDAL